MPFSLSLWNNNDSKTLDLSSKLDPDNKPPASLNLLGDQRPRLTLTGLLSYAFRAGEMPKTIEQIIEQHLLQRRSALATNQSYFQTKGGIPAHTIEMLNSQREKAARTLPASYPQISDQLRKNKILKDVHEDNALATLIDERNAELEQFPQIDIQTKKALEKQLALFFTPGHRASVISDREAIAFKQAQDAARQAELEAATRERRQANTQQRVSESLDAWRQKQLEAQHMRDARAENKRPNIPLKSKAQVAQERRSGQSAFFAEMHKHLAATYLDSAPREVTERTKIADNQALQAARKAVGRSLSGG